MGEVKELKKVTVDDNGDDAYCEALYREYLSAPIEDKELVSLDKAIINLNRGSVSPAIDLSDMEKEEVVEYIK